MKLLLHPLPVRIFHWVMALSVTVLMLTGLHLSGLETKLAISYRAARALHGIFSVILIFNLLGQVYYYLVTGKYGDVIFNKRDWSNFPSFFRYYTFQQADHPKFGRYNPGQKLIFDSWALAILLTTVGGIILMFPGETLAWQYWLGNLQTWRVIHFAVAIYFVMTIPVHIYLVFTEDLSKLQAMVTGYVMEEPKKESKQKTQ